MSEASCPDWRVRLATPGDARALALVGAATFLESFAGVIDGDAIVAHCDKQHSVATYERYLAGGASAWIAEAAPGAAPVGYALLTRPELAQAGDGDVELKRIYLLSRFHGSGIAPALMDAAVAAAGDAERLLLGVYNGNARAIAFYRKHGFSVIGERRFSVGPESYDDFVLARPIRSEIRT